MTTLIHYWQGSKLVVIHLSGQPFFGLGQVKIIVTAPGTSEIHGYHFIYIPTFSDTHR